MTAKKGVTKMGRRPKLTQADADYAVELYKQYFVGSRGSQLVEQLAKRFNVSTMTMYKYLRLGGIYNPNMKRVRKNEDSSTQDAGSNQQG